MVASSISPTTTSRLSNCAAVCLAAHTSSARPPHDAMRFSRLGQHCINGCPQSCQLASSTSFDEVQRDVGRTHGPWRATRASRSRPFTSAWASVLAPKVSPRLTPERRFLASFSFLSWLRRHQSWATRGSEDRAAEHRTGCTPGCHGVIRRSSEGTSRLSKVVPVTSMFHRANAGMSRPRVASAWRTGSVCAPSAVPAFFARPCGGRE